MLPLHILSIQHISFVNIGITSPHTGVNSINIIKVS